MKKIETETSKQSVKKLSCFIADSEYLIKQAQALRYRIFAEEMGAKLKTESEGLDYDEVDDYCDHLIVYVHLNSAVGRVRRANCYVISFQPAFPRVVTRLPEYREPLT